MNKLIITADDFGMCDSVNNSIFDCINSGVILSTNVMVNMDSAYKIKDIIRYGDEISVGLHWNLTVGKPVLPASQISTIVDKNGNFLDSKSLKSALKKGKVNKLHLKNELLAQYKKFNELYGCPKYWNTHENIHLNIFLFKFFIDLAYELGIFKMRCHNRINVKGSKGEKVKNNLLRILKIIFVKYWNKYAKKKGMTMPDGVLVFANYSDRYSIRDFYSRICWNKYEGIVEMYVHPSIEEKCEYFGNITNGRVKEYIMCKDMELAKFLSSEGIQIASFKDL